MRAKILIILMVLVCLSVGGFFVYKSVTRLESEKPEVETKEEVIRPKTGEEVVKITFPEMVLIPAGIFRMGGERFFWENLISGDPLIRGPELPEMEWPQEELTYNERPIHQISLDSFYLSRNEITNQQFKEFIDDTGYVTTVQEQGSCGAMIRNKQMEEVEGEIRGADWQHPLGPEDNISEKLNHPVACVSWIDAIYYLNWLSKKENLESAYFYNDKEKWELKPDVSGYRLPTEAEWEYAAIGGNEKRSIWWLDPSKKFWIFPHGNLDMELRDGDYMNLYQLAEESDQYDYTSPTGSFPANGYGLYDMAGNVREWINDWYSDVYYQYCVDNNITKNPLGLESGTEKVSRGGSWADCHCGARTTARGGLKPNTVYNYVGFRIARNLK